MQSFNFSGEYKMDPQNDAFQQWLIDTCTNPDLPPSEMESRLINWAKAPFARYCHPREEHLLPLHVCAGIAKSNGDSVFDAGILGKRSIAFLWR